ncbi:MAG: MATE family efflux transporter [Sarcina sp.]
MKGILKDKKFLKSLWVLAVPIVIQNFIMSSLNLVDNLMIGNLGEEAIAAVGLANQYFFVFMLCITGITAGASIFMAQYWGKKDTEKIKTVLGLSLVIGFVASILFATGAFFMPEAIMGILSQDPVVIDLGVDYLQMAAISYLITNITMAYSAALRSTEQPSVPMFASILGVIVNAFLNWVFIFGNLGAPEMGVMGAALATTIARVVEMAYILIMVYVKKNNVAANIKELLSFDMSFVKTYFKTSWSVIVNELIWSVGMMAYSIAYARIGTQAVASMQIATTIINLFMVIGIGIAVAACIMIGNKIGAGQEEEAKDYAIKIGILSPVVGAMIGLGLWIFAPLAVTPFNISAETAASTILVLRLVAIFTPIRTFNVVMIIGVLRGGGDTTFSMMVQAGTVWLYSVPGAFIGATVLGLPLIFVYLIICTEEFIKLFFEISRLKSGKWIRNVIQDNEEIAVGMAN